MQKKILNAREPFAAGQFYPDGKEELLNQVNGFLAEAQKAGDGNEGALLGLVVPHAGYVFSGSVAAAGFKQIEGKNIETIILIGNSHRAYFEGAAVYTKGYFKTPLGEVEIDAELAGKIIAENKIIKADASAHEKEHSLEVEVPFLQRTLKNFKLMPILMGNGDRGNAEILAKAVSKNIAGKNVYEAILTGEVENLRTAVAELHKENIPDAQTFLCGEAAVETLMFIMRDLGAGKIKLLKYANSGDSAFGDKSQVVGYTAIGFYGNRRGAELNFQEQEQLLEIARKSIESFVETGKIPEFTVKTAVLNQKLGAFVTLEEYEQLRGCIGHFTGDAGLPLWQTVREMAVAAASEDPRFMPVQTKELPELKYEISVLGPLEKIDDWRRIEIGKHGVQIRKGFKGGVFLPQVATENNWGREEFLENLCGLKAGLPKDCYKDKDTEIYVFTAQVFGDKGE
ncbi:MAG: AmmeMemoRadiSam system protein B [bacterium]|nr:AmmeMemoRadiSam system protein B [bacterium]